MRKDWYTFVDALIDRLREAHIIVTVYCTIYMPEVNAITVTEPLMRERTFQ